MRIICEAFSPLDELLPSQEYTVVSNFAVEVLPYVIGLWVARPDPNNPNRVEPIYLTAEQLEQAEQTHD